MGHAPRLGFAQCGISRMSVERINEATEAVEKNQALRNVIVVD